MLNILCRNKPGLLSQQHGMATLGTALILLLAITLMTFASARVGVTEQRTAANDYRAKQAIEAAQAGLERALHNANAAGVINTGAANAYGAATTGTLGTPALTRYSYSYAYPLAAPGTSNVMLLSIKSTGYSDDNTSVKTITQLFKRHPYLPDIPDDPARTGGDYESNSNSISITNTLKSIALRAQGEIDTHDKTISSASGGSPAGSGLTESSITPDVIGVVNTAGEKIAFFQDVFGTTQEDVKDQSLVIDCSGNCNSQLGNPSANQIKGPLLWVNTPSSTGTVTLNSNTVIGTATQPVVLIIDGNLDLGGGVVINGFIYVTGCICGSAGAGNTTINGSLVTVGDMELGGNVTINYVDYSNPGATPGAAGPDLYVKISGTWTD